MKAVFSKIQTAAALWAQPTFRTYIPRPRGCRGAVNPKPLRIPTAAPGSPASHPDGHRARLCAHGRLKAADGKGRGRRLTGGAQEGGGAECCRFKSYPRGRGRGRRAGGGVGGRARVPAGGGGARQGAGRRRSGAAENGREGGGSGVWPRGSEGR